MRIQQSINSGSMADIAFLLLVFFMVTTTIQSEVGLMRKLPPEEERSGKIKERNVLRVMVNKQDGLMVNNQVCELPELRDKALEFILNSSNLEHLPEKQLTDIALIGTYPVSRQVISLQSDLRTSYGTYVKIQDELAAAYIMARDELSREVFNATYDDLIDERAKAKIDAIRSAIPMRISEAEPYQTE